MSKGLAMKVFARGILGITFGMGCTLAGVFNILLSDNGIAVASHTRGLWFLTFRRA